MKCPSCEATFKATPVDGKVTCPECGKKLKVKQKTEEKAEEKKVVTPKEESKQVKEEVLEEKKITPQKEEDDFDEFDDLDEFADMDTNKKSSTTVKTSSPFLFNEDEDDEEEDDDFDDEDEDEEEAAPKKKSKVKAPKENNMVSGDALTFKQAVVAVLVPCIPVVGFLLLILGACGVIFKGNDNIKNLYRAQLLVGVVAGILMIIIMLLFGLGSAAMIGSLMGV